MLTGTNASEIPMINIALMNPLFMLNNKCSIEKILILIIDFQSCDNTNKKLLHITTNRVNILKITIGGVSAAEDLEKAADIIKTGGLLS
ncbi:hypothetical protein ICC18_22705 [Paenibacillus sp. WST5]|uniref:Uncharacterized protein n=1 Tax=Paenibacillus sedimenti TaxID=2770274 RepID=A0A926KRU7_9BACL|nr:hypothetical protein [Paenibacillus sedimenti]